MLSLDDVGVLQPGLRCLGLVVRVAWVGLYGHRVRRVLMSSGFGDELRLVHIICSLEGWSQDDAIGVSRMSEPRVLGCRFGVVVLRRRWPGHPRPSRDPPYA